MIEIPTIKDIVSNLYEGRMSTHTMEKSVVKGITKFERVQDLEDVPCRVSYKRKGANVNVGDKDQEVVIYCDPEVVIKPGSIITVNQAGKETEYELSGEPAVYAGHQEVYVTLYRERA